MREELETTLEDGRSKSISSKFGSSSFSSFPYASGSMAISFLILASTVGKFNLSWTPPCCNRCTGSSWSSHASSPFATAEHHNTENTHIMYLQESTVDPWIGKWDLALNCWRPVLRTFFVKVSVIGAKTFGTTKRVFNCEPKQLPYEIEGYRFMQDPWSGQ